MENTYIIALIDSLNKKIEVLNEIHQKDEEQLELLSDENFSFDKFDKNTDEKGLLIYKLNALDDGFELVYEKVKEELVVNKTLYADEIRLMQSLISKITDLSTKIQAEEVRNKAKLENVFKQERSKLRNQRSSVNAINSYTKTMRNFPIN